MSDLDKQKLMRVIREILAGGTEQEKRSVVKWMANYLEAHEQ